MHLQTRAKKATIIPLLTDYEYVKIFKKLKISGEGHSRELPLLACKRA
jgi:hypothetical protein